MAKSRSKAARDNRANQLNPTHPAYHRSRGASQAEANHSAGTSKPVNDNRSRQLNPKDAVYRMTRGDGAESSSASSNPSSPKAE
ncbi:MAG: hypothetical protein CSA24_01105 [Deltaproteobacteria bacterium]|nr:MAG: hypothetical protein CSA24_01105 [Deltaproteobacteria bacterium]